MSAAAHPRVAIAASAALALLLSLIFQFNLFGIAPERFFNEFQLNGQARVLGPLVAEKVGLDTGGVHLGKVYRGKPDQPPEELASTGDTHELFDRGASPTEQLAFEPYKAQFGLQSMTYAAAHRVFGMDRGQLQYASSLAFAAALVALCALYRRIYGSLFAALFLVSIAASPWMIAMGRNLYWTPALFLLPAIAAAMLFLEPRKPRRLFWCVCIAVAMAIKCLSNYEYITSITLLACSVFLAGPFFRRDAGRRRPDLRAAAAVFAACVAGFCVAFAVHAHSRTGDILTGAQEIYEHDIKRRTYGDPSRYTEETGRSLAASPLAVLKIYTLEWPEKRLMILPGKLFLALLAFAVLGLAVRLFLRDEDALRDTAMFVTFLAVPLSWFMLAKGHSFTQTHINFVLWYLGFIPALLYVASQTARFLLGRLWRGARAAS